MLCTRRKPAGGERVARTRTGPVHRARARKTRLARPVPESRDRKWPARGGIRRRYRMLLAVPRARLVCSLLVPLVLLPAGLAAQSQKISGALAHSPASSGGDVREVRFSPDGSRLLYLADQDQAGAVDLYSAPASGGAAAVRLSAAVAGSGGQSFELTATHAVFTGPGLRLSSAPLDGSAPAVVLSTNASGMRLAPDGSRAFWLEFAEDISSSQLYSAPLDGSAPAALVPAPGVPYVERVELTPDGARALLVGGADPLGTTVYALGLGGVAPVALAPLVAGENALALELAPDSSRAVFSRRTGDYPDFQIQLFSAPCDGSSPAVALSDVLPFDRQGRLFLEVSP